MAEGMPGGILGGEDEKPEVEVPEALPGTEAFAAAVAAKLAGNDPGVARKTEEFLSDQSHLLKLQARHLQDEHRLRVAHLRNQLREEKVRRFSLRLRVGFQLFIALVAAIIGIAAAIMIRDAFASRRVVIEPFDAPPALAARGLTGKVVATGLLDELSRLQDATRSLAAARTLSSAWASDIKLEVPETGVSLGELSRLLRARFGHDVHVDGDLMEAAAGGLALTVRGNGVPAKTFSASATEVERLTVESAEYVYSKSQPARWAAYLTTVERYEEAIAFCRTAVASADPVDRPGFLSTWSNAIESTGGSTREALALLRAAVKLQPDFWNAYSNRIS